MVLMNYSVDIRPIKLHTFWRFLNRISRSLLPAIYWGDFKNFDVTLLDQLKIIESNNLLPGASLPYDHAHVHWRRVATMEMQEKLFRPDILCQLKGMIPFLSLFLILIRPRKLSKKNQYMYVDQHTFLLNDHLRKMGQNEHGSFS